MMKKIPMLVAASVAFVWPTALPCYAQDVATPGDINIDDNTPEGKARIAQEDAMNRFIALSLLNAMEQMSIMSDKNLMGDAQEECRMMIKCFDRESLAKCPEPVRKIINNLIALLEDAAKDPAKAKKGDDLLDENMDRLEECYNSLTGKELEEVANGMLLWAKNRSDVGEKLIGFLQGDEKPDAKVVNEVVKKLRDALKAQQTPFLPKATKEEVEI